MNALLLSFLFIGSALSAVISPRAEGPECPLAPSIDVPAGFINITLGDPSGEEGTVIIHISTESRHEGGVATGLQDLWYSYTFTLIGLRIEFAAEIPGQVCIEGESYTADGDLDFSPFTEAVAPTGTFNGAGSYRACINDFRISGSLRLQANIITGKVSVRDLTVADVGFTSVDANLEGLAVNGELVDWPTWSAALKENFDAEIPIHGEAFSARVADAATYALSPYTLDELLEIINPDPSTGPPTTCAPVL